MRKCVNKKGFTLTELLIVIIIVGIVVTLAIPRYRKQVRRMQSAEAKKVLRSLSDAVWRHYQETGEFPDVSEKLDTKAPQSKYFVYSYSKFAEFWGEGLWKATYKDEDSALLGEIIDYFISYYPSPQRFSPTAPPQLFQKMDDKWWRFFFVLKKGVGSGDKWD